MSFERLTRWRPLFHYGTVKHRQSPGRAGGFLGVISAVFVIVHFNAQWTLSF